MLLAIVTFGIYSIIWNYKAHHEVYVQFELQQEGRSDGVLWLALGVALFAPLMWVYHNIFVKNINSVHARFGLHQRISNKRFLTQTIIGNFFVFIGFVLFVVGIIFLAIDSRGDDPFTPEDETITPAEADRLNELGRIFLPIGGGIFVGSMVLLVNAYFALQRTINEIWEHLGHRMVERTGTGAAPFSAQPVSTLQ